MCLFSNVSNRVLQWKEHHWHLEASNWDLKNHWVMSHMLLTAEMLRLRLVHWSSHPRGWRYGGFIDLLYIYSTLWFTNTNRLLWPLTCDPNEHLLEEFLVSVWKFEVLFNTTWCSLFVNTVLCKEKKPLKKNTRPQFSSVSQSVLPRAHHVQFQQTKTMTCFKSRCSRTNARCRRGHARLLRAVKSHQNFVE